MNVALADEEVVGSALKVSGRLPRYDELDLHCNSNDWAKEAYIGAKEG